MSHTHKRSRVAIARQRVATACALSSEQFHSMCPSLSRYIVDDTLTLAIKYVPSNALTAAQLQSLYALTESNMAVLYAASGWGWDAKKKLSELSHKHAKYILLTTIDTINSTDHDADTGAVVGFVHLRFELEQFRPVLYMYELQLSPEVQRQGLGRILVSTCESLMAKLELQSVMLTVLNVNSAARKFYERLGFGLDNTCPDDAEYKILSKINESYR